MKKLLHLTFLVILVASIAGCEADRESELVKEETSSLYRLSLQNGQLSTEQITVEAFKEYGQAIIKTRGDNNSSANGLFNLGPLMCTFSAMENNSGVHGNGHLSGDGFFQDVKINADCITVVDNVAFWGGEITKWVVADPDLLPYDVGWIMVLSVKDNGKGRHDDPDEIGSSFVVAPPGSLPSDFNLPYDTWCAFADAVYNGEEGSPFFIPGDDPTNINVK